MGWDNLKASLLGVTRNDLFTAGLTRLIHCGTAYATAILRVRFCRFIGMLENAGYTIEAAALRCIEDLYLPVDGQPCARLHDLLLAETQMIRDMSEEECQRVYKKCLFLQIQQTLPELLGEYDPQYRKILRLVKEVLSHSRFKRKQSFHEHLYHRVPDVALLLRMPAMHSDELLIRLIPHVNGNMSTERFVNTVFDILDEQEQYRRLVSIGTLVGVIRDYYFMVWKVESGSDRETAPMFDADDVERLLHPVLSCVRNTILHNYLNRNILQPEEARKYEHAIRNMLTDFANRTPRTWFEYYALEFPGVTQQKYRQNYRTRFEYTLGAAKERFLEQCRLYFTK